MLKFDFNFFWTIFNLIIFFLLMRLFLLKPIKKTIDARKDLIQKQFDDAAEVSAQADQKLLDYEEKIANVEQEAQEIVSEARGKAKVEYDKIIDRANADATKLKDDAKKQIELDSENARLSVKEDIAKLAMETAQKVVASQAGADLDSNIYDQFLNESSENND